jgi:hypothetical protein
LPLDIFWISNKEEYPEIARRAVVILRQFYTLPPSLTTMNCKERENLTPTKMK